MWTSRPNYCFGHNTAHHVQGGFCTIQPSSSSLRAFWVTMGVSRIHTVLGWSNTKPNNELGTVAPTHGLHQRTKARAALKRPAIPASAFTSVSMRFPA